MDTTRTSRQTSEDDAPGGRAPGAVAPGDRAVGDGGVRDGGVGTGGLRLGRIVRWLTRLAAGSMLVAALVCLVAVESGGETNLLVVLLAALSGWVMPLILVAGALFALTRWWRATAVAAVVALFAVAALFQLPDLISSARAASTRGGLTPLKVMSLNIEIGGVDPGQLVARVRQERPDVLVLTELTPEAVARLHAAGLDDVLPHSFARPGPNATGTGIWTQQPLTDQRAIPGTTYAALVGTLAVNGRPVTIAGVHPNAPTDLGRWESDYRILAQELDPKTVGAFPATGSWGEVVAGDFNSAVTNGPLARLLDTGLQDGALRGPSPLATWFGAGQTWPADYPFPPVIRIDHVLTDRGTGVQSFDTFRIADTDHLGVIATIGLSLQG